MSEPGGPRSEESASGGGGPPEKAAPPRGKDWWDKCDIVLKPVGGLVTAATIAILGWQAQSYLQARAQQETRVSLYSQLLSNREQSESQLRSTMFSKIIDAFAGGENTPEAEPEQLLLYLELLVHNFHEALNLAPLFSHMKRRIVQAGADEKLSDEERERIADRLSSLASEVGRKQLMVLAPRGVVIERTFIFCKRPGSKSGIPAGNSYVGTNGTFSLAMCGKESENGEGDTKLVLDEVFLVKGRDGDERKIPVKLFVENVDPPSRRVRVVLLVDDPQLDGQNPPEFWIDDFDFPMIDNTRLSGDYRLAATLIDFSAMKPDEANGAIGGAARIAVVAFPGEYASLKDRTFLQDVLDDLKPPEPQPSTDTKN